MLPVTAHANTDRAIVLDRLLDSFVRRNVINAVLVSAYLSVHFCVNGHDSGVP